MAHFHSPRMITDGLVLYLDAANPKLKKNALFYKWFVTNGTNPTTKSGFDAFFNVSPESSGIDEGREIDWIVVADRPSYITQTVNFAWEVSGFLIIDEPGTYIFNTRSDDGNELQINGQIVTSFYGGRGVPTPGDISSPINLNVGVYSFLYRMQQGGGGAGAQVRWQKPNSTSYEVIPSTNFAVGLDNNVFVDLSGNGNNGTLVNGPTFDSDNLGSLVFDGVDDFISYNNLLNVGNTFTVITWVRPTNKTRQTIISNGYPYLANKGFFITCPGNNSTSTFISLGNDQKVAISTNNTVVSNTIQMMSYVVNSTDLIKIYRNTTEVSYTTQTDGNINLQYDSGVFVTGRRNNLNTDFLNSPLFNLQIYNRALSAQEILQNYNATKGRYGL